MREWRERLWTHRNDVLVLLEQVSRTAQLHSGFRLAGAVSHLAQAQALLAEELESLVGEPEQERGESGGEDEESTPVNGIPLDGRSR